MTNKKERRLQRHLKNKEKDQTSKEAAWNSGKLIKPNHNHKPYSILYSDQLGERLITRLRNFKQASSDNEEYLMKFRTLRIKCIEYILHYDFNFPKSNDFKKIKLLLDTYWDEPDNLINIEL